MFEKIRLASGISFVALALGVTACNPTPVGNEEISFPEAVNQTQTVSNTSTLSGNIKVDGSSTVYPISKAMAAAFQKNHSGVQVDIGVSGTGGGFKKFCAGETDITGASRPIDAEEMAACQQGNVEYVELPIAFDGLTVVVSSQNNFVDCLKTSELRTLWEPGAEGKVTTWNQVRSDFPNQPISLYGPDKESGTFDYFTLAIVGEEGKSRSDYAPSKTDDALVQGVSGNPNALGYFGYAYYLANRDQLKLVAINSGYGCVKPSPKTIADSSYQPLSRPVFIYVKKAAAERPEVKAFTEFYLSPKNADIILEVGDVPLPNITLRTALSRFERGRTGTVFGGKGSVLGVKQQDVQ